MERVAISLGSNLGDRAAQIAAGVDGLRALIPDLIVSPLIDTEPVGVGPQPRFLNGAAVGTWPREAGELLFELLRIEREVGRIRPHPGAARTLDLDLILFGCATIATATLTVPHPRFRDRRFVLAPLAAIAPDMRDPVTGATVAELLRRLGAVGR